MQPSMRPEQQVQFAVKLANTGQRGTLVLRTHLVSSVNGEVARFPCVGCISKEAIRVSCLHSVRPVSIRWVPKAGVNAFNPTI